MKRELSFAAGLIPAIFFSGSAEGEESPPLPATPSSQIEIQELEVDPAAIRFTPPPPPKPAPAVALTRASTIEKGTHALILAVGETSTLPDISPPPSPLPYRPWYIATVTKPLATLVGEIRKPLSILKHGVRGIGVFSVR